MLLYHETVRFPSISRDFQRFQTYAEAISEPPLAAPDSNLPKASGAADQRSVLLLRRSAAIGDEYYGAAEPPVRCGEVLPHILVFIH